MRLSVQHECAVSVTLGEVPATCHNARSASASSGPSKVAIKEPTMQGFDLSASAISTNAGLSIVTGCPLLVSVTFGEVPATCHKARSASASVGLGHSRMKNALDRFLCCRTNGDRQ